MSGWPCVRGASFYGITVAIFLLLLCSCTTHYDLTLRNGEMVRASTKPKLNSQGSYVFKDLAGHEVTVNSMRVRQIEPVRRGSPQRSDF